ncbi:MAG: hypothetical protein WC684_03215 [Hyphomicrobium sp.]
MQSKLDIRAQIAADAALQAEISQALVAIADSLPQGTDLRVARIVLRTLEASWDEHVSFRDEVVFPIVLGRHTRRVAFLVDRLRSDHARIRDGNSDIVGRLQALLGGVSYEPAGLESALRGAFALRHDHLQIDAELSSWLPDTFSPTEQALSSVWQLSRPSPRFPLNLLKATRKRNFRLGGRLN